MRHSRNGGRRGTTFSRIAATAATIGSAAVIGLSFHGLSGAEAAVGAGSAEIVEPSDGAPLRSGGSRTGFRIKLPTGAACKGDSAKAGYRIQSYLIPHSVDLASLAFDSTGPVPVPGQFRAPLYEATPSANSWVDRLTAEADPTGGPGAIVQPLPTFSFAVFDPAFGFPFTPGTYHIGIACTLGPPSATQQEKYWSSAMTITADPADSGPAKIRWTVTAPSSPSTTSNGSPVGWMAASTVIAVVGVLLLCRRRRGLAVPSLRPSPPHPAKETR